MAPARRFRCFTLCLLALSFLALHLVDSAGAQVPTDLKPAFDSKQLFARDNLVAWCIVPFDGKKRGPAERAAMCAKLGLKKVAYDWRNEHIATFEEEILEYRKHGIEYFAFWGGHEEAYRLFRKYDLHPQIWRTAGSPAGKTQIDRVRAAAQQMLPLVDQARELGCKVGLYNHGGWGGDPENLVAVCEYLRKHHNGAHVGIVYNLHHAHSQLDVFAKKLALMKPYLLCLNLNGMTHDGEARGQKILPLGEGELDVSLAKTIRNSGYAGPIGIIGHTQDDVEQRLQDNLDGLDWIVPQLDGKAAGSKPTPRTWSPQSTALVPTAASIPGVILQGKAEYRSPPITVEARVTLPDRSNYNIVVASDTKSSGAHWEIFSQRGSGALTVYTPGLSPDHTSSTAMICDGKPHSVSMIYEADRIRLFVDGKSVASQQVASKGRNVVPGGLAIGKLVEGGIGSSGLAEWVRISRGVRGSVWKMAHAPAKDESTVLLWKRPDAANAQHGAIHHGPDASAKAPGKVPEYSAELVASLQAAAKEQGNAGRGIMVFAAAKSACLSCHKFGQHGGSVGPPLHEIGKQRRPEEIIEAVLWPMRHVKPEFVAHLVVKSNGQSFRGYIIKEDEQQLQLKDPTRPTDAVLTILKDDIEIRREVGTLMPDNLTASMSESQLRDLLQFLLGLGKPDGIPLAEVESVIEHTHAHLHGPVAFNFDRKPLNPKDWPSWQEHINRDRIYDFYTKEAEHFRAMEESGQHVPALLMEYPGLDGGELGHWGNQDENTWASNAWNDVKLGSVQAGVFRGNGVTVPRGVCVQLGADGELACCFNPDTLTYDAVWKGGFVKFSSVRHGFLHGLMMDGTAIPFPEKGTGPDGEKIAEPFEYLGFSRIGRDVFFSYRIGKTEYLDSPGVKDGEFVRQVVRFSSSALSALIKSQQNVRQWPQSFETEIRHGSASPYAVDTIELPIDNPWRIPLFGGDLGFLPDGSALVCTMHGDVWRVSGLQYPSTKAVWNRFASGLHHCQGMIVDKDGIFVLGREQLTRLHDLNEDGEADYYECFSNAFQTSAAGHDFICGLERDADGNFYTASGNQGIVRISADGRKANVVATGFRNPDGIGLTSDGFITVPCSEGSWTPASSICAFRPNGANADASQSVPYFGYPGPRDGQVPQLPLAWLPRGVDNSAGGQQTVTSDRWGPLKGQLLHFSFGTGAHFLMLRDDVAGQQQGAIVPLVGEFLSGAHRGRFSPHDGQLYVTGMQGWGSYTPQPGCFQRVRYTGDLVQLPIGFEIYRNGVLLNFAAPLDVKIGSKAGSHFAQSWNYRYSAAYGSPEFSSRHPLMRGHDHLAISSAHVVAGGTSLFLEMPDLQPVSQLHLRVKSGNDKSHDLYVTVHMLREEQFTDAPGLMNLADKTINPHPILADLAMATRSVPNPHAQRKKGGRKITIETAGNLSFATRSFSLQPGELIEFTLSNPDVVPHNWALLKPGTLERVGHLANRLISDPEAAVRQYIPQTDDVLFYTDVVLPKDESVIYFNAPKQPGRYPYLCTFPGHWLVMNGEMIVEQATPPGG
ncbi:MAG: TIM barrel protein [Planctomycetota bacterium]|nr:TIM barrel protein [Planctomycetota bacterium]